MSHASRCHRSGRPSVAASASSLTCPSPVCCSSLSTPLQLTSVFRSQLKGHHVNIGESYHRSTAGQAWDAIVIGSGIGGLTTAAFLARTGQRVLVLEKHSTAGGATQTSGAPDTSGTPGSTTWATSTGPPAACAGSSTTSAAASWSGLP
ncbi:oleate hydratase [Streptomyces sp. enrichment culture]|uniref:oleate hydratase n=1 Tax=Streptomyces sp. enrichment culture TaxID=1795815 RepID=UPI003F55EAFE